MNKIFACVTFFLLTACQQLTHGQLQPVKTVDIKNGVYFTTCSGAVEDWGSCKDKANQTCPNGYESKSRVESAVAGRRELTFQCKK